MSAMNVCIFYFVILFQLLFVGPSLACNGYDITIRKIENCGGDGQVLTLDTNTTVSLTPNCEVVTNGCSSTSGFQQATVTYTIKKNGFKLLSGTEDLCDVLTKNKDNAKATETLQMFGLPTQCPVEEGRTCTTPAQKLSIEKQKTMLPMAVGNLEVDVDIKHDKGTSCIKITADIKKSRKG